jgi:hypothetical protein
MAQQAVPLERFRGSIDDWALLLSGTQSSIGWGQVTGGANRHMNDNWKQMPRMVLAVWEECRLLPAPLQSRVRNLDAWHVTEAQLRALIQERGATP